MLPIKYLMFDLFHVFITPPTSTFSQLTRTVARNTSKASDSCHTITLLSYAACPLSQITGRIEYKLLLSLA